MLLSGSQDSKIPPRVRVEQVPDHLMRLNMYKTMGPYSMHPRVLEELADVAKILSLKSDKQWLLNKVPSDRKKANIIPIFRKERN